MSFAKALRTGQHFLPGGRDRRESISRAIRQLRGKPHDADFEALRYFPPGQMLLDIGANYGQSVVSMRMMQSKSSIVSYEPNSDLAGKITALFRHDRAVKVQPFGLSASAGAFDLFVPYYGNYPYPGLASLKEEEATGWLSAETLYFFRPENVEIRRIRCRIETLDSQAIAPYFMKIDVQGAEFDVLCGGEATLATHHPILLIESPGRDQRVGTLLAALGYQEFEFTDGHFFQRVSESDNAFFMTGARQAELSERNPRLFRTAVTS